MWHWPSNYIGTIFQWCWREIFLGFNFFICFNTKIWNTRNSKCSSVLGVVILALDFGFPATDEKQSAKSFNFFFFVWMTVSIQFLEIIFLIVLQKLFGSRLFSTSSFSSYLSLMSLSLLEAIMSIIVEDSCTTLVGLLIIWVN